MKYRELEDKNKHAKKKMTHYNEVVKLNTSGAA